MGWWSDIQKARSASSRLRQEAAAAEAEYSDYQQQQALYTASPHDDAALTHPTQDPLQRIAQEAPPNLQAKDKPKAHNIDPLDTYTTTGPHVDDERHGGSTTLGLSMNALDMISKVSLVDSIIGARVFQVAEHGTPQTQPFEVGYRVQLRDPKQRSSAAAQKRAQEIARWIFTCGDPRLKEFNTFENHLKACVRDSLVYDQFCAEVVRGWDSKPAGVLGVDARTIRRARPTTQEIANLRYAPPNRGNKFVQIVDNKVVAQWGQDEFIFGVRNPRNDIRVNGYGYPELERLLTVIGDAVNSIQYNAANFRNGTHAAGILALSSSMSKEMFDAWSNQVRSMTSGASNAHRVLTVQIDPLSKESINLVPLNSNNREMEYQAWLGFLLKLICSGFQMDPAEIGFVYGNEGQSGTLSQAGPGERIQSSKERGLRPLLRAVQTWWNYKIVYNIDPDFELVLAGFDKATELLKQEFLGKVVRTHWTVNEIRAIDDLPPLETPAATLGPMDGVFQSAYQWHEQMKQQQEQQAQQQQAAEASMDAGDVLPPQAEGEQPAEGLSADDLVQMFGSEEEEEEPANGAVAKSIRFELN